MGSLWQVRSRGGGGLPGSVARPTDRFGGDSGLEVYGGRLESNDRWQSLSRTEVRRGLNLRRHQSPRGMQVDANPEMWRNARFPRGP